MRLVRQRDGASLEARLSTEHASSSYGIPVLVIGGEAFGVAETHGYLLAEANDGERADLRRWGYNLLPAPAPDPA